MGLIDSSEMTRNRENIPRVDYYCPRGIPNLGIRQCVKCGSAVFPHLTKDGGWEWKCTYGCIGRDLSEASRCLDDRPIVDRIITNANQLLDTERLPCGGPGTEGWN